MAETVGLAGCGRMGAAMVSALRRSGINARAFDTHPERGDTAPLASFREGLTTLISVVRDEAETDALLFDTQSLATVPTLETIIISSTLSPTYTKSLSARVPATVALIDAPMSGAQVKAEAGTLSFMLGGDQTSLAKHMSLFEAMGQDIHIMGDFGSGMSAKVLNNLLAASHTAMTRLVLDWADHAGIDEAQLLALINASSGQNWLASGFDTIEFARDGFRDDNSIGILTKDVTAGLDMAPAGADRRLPETVRRALFALKPRA